MNVKTGFLERLNIIFMLFTSLLLLIVGSMVPSSILVPENINKFHLINIQSSFQIPSMLLSSIICGRKITITAVLSYIIIGLFILPIFNGGGSVGYILTPEFGYILGMIPASIIIQNKLLIGKCQTIINLMILTSFRIITIHFVGILYILFWSIQSIWSESYIDLITQYSLLRFPSQIMLTTLVSLLGFILIKIDIAK